MRRFIVLLSLLWIVSVSSSAQNTIAYQLRDLTVDEFMAESAPILAPIDKGNIVRDTVVNEFILRYEYEQLYNSELATLIAFQEALRIGELHPQLSQFQDRLWFEIVITLALEDQTLVEQDASQLVNDIYVWNVRGVDVDGDNIQEFVFDVSTGSSISFFAFLNDEHITLLFENSPIPQLEGELSNIVDIDNDGDDELFFWMSNNILTGVSCDTVSISDWQGDSLVNLTLGAFDHCTVDYHTIEPVQLILDHPEIIEMTSTQSDGWNCAFTQRDILNRQSHELSSTTTLADTAWCDLRLAQEAIDRQDYSPAIDYYLSALDDVTDQMVLYVTAKLAIAYALNGQLDEAIQTLGSVEATGQMGDLIIALRNNSENTEALCQSAYDFFRAIEDSREDLTLNQFPWTPEDFHFGSLRGWWNDYPTANPSIAGCAINVLLPSDPTPNPTPIIYPERASSFIDSRFAEQLTEGDYQTVLDKIDEFLALSDDELMARENGHIYPDLHVNLLYWRALTLEFMGNVDEALAQYIAIYESDPESAWGRLARLHFESAE
ncbi:MAG: hypothetical protein AAFV98_17730 [Chloroflexota bacterium]